MKSFLGKPNLTTYTSIAVALASALGQLSCGTSPVLTDNRNISGINPTGATEGKGGMGSTGAPDGLAATERLARDLVDNNSSFEALLQAEKEERIAADLLLNKRVFELEGRMDEFSDFVTSEIARLDKSDAKILNQLKLTRDELSYAIDETKDTLREEARLRDQAMKDSIAENEKQIAQLRNELATNSDQDEARAKELQEQISDFEHLLEAQKTELEQQIKDQGQTLKLAQEKAMEAISQQMSNLDTNLNKKMNDLQSQQQAKLSEVASQFEEKQKQMEVDTNQRIRELNAAMNAQAEELWDAVSNLDEKTAAKLRELLRGQVESEASIREALDLLGSSMENELDYQVRKLTVEREIAEEEVRERFAEMQDRQNLEAKMQRAEMQKMQSDLEQSIAKQKNELQTAMTENKEDILNLMNSETEALHASIESLDKSTAIRISRLAEEQEAFRKFAQVNFATKNELLVVRSFAEGVMDVTNTLGKKIDDNDVRAQRLISETIFATKDELANEIAKVNATIEGVRGQFSESLGRYRGEVQKLGNKLEDEISAVKSSLSTMRGDILASQADLRKEMMERLEKKALEFEYLSQANKLALSSKIKELDARVDMTNSELMTAKLQAKKDLAEAIKFEQAKREEIQQSLDKLAGELEKIAEIAKANRDMAAANQFEIKRLGQDFATEQEKVAERFQVMNTKLEQGLEALRADFKKDLEIVSNEAAKMVEDLDEETQKQFKQNAMEMAELKQKQAALSVSMADLVGEINNDLLAQSEFENQLPELTSNATKSLSGLIESMQELQQTFVESIGPNQDNPGPINESFGAIQAQCEGNPEATFANAMGGDYFDFLAKQYVRNLLIDERTQATADLFFRQPQLIPKDNQLGFKVAIATTQPEGASENKQCLTMINSWAQNVFSSIVNGDAEIKTMLERLKGSTSLNRQVITLRNEAAKATEATAKIENLIKTTIGTDTDELSAASEDKPSVMARLSAMLVEGALNEINLKQREYAFNRMKETQEKLLENQIKLAEELKASNDAQAKALRAEAIRRQAAIASSSMRIMEQMNKLEGRLSRRIDEVAQKTQNLEDSYKQALNVMMSLAGRAGYPDLQASIMAAGQKIDYKPIEVNQVRPVIAEIQHFYTAETIASFQSMMSSSAMQRWNQHRLPKLHHSGNTCTGLVPMRGAGINTYNSCWVNFRGIPTNQAIGTVRGMFFRVFGAANKIKIWGQGSTTVNEVGKDAIIKGGSAENGVFDISSKSLFPTNDWRQLTGWKTLYFQPYSYATGGYGKAVSYKMKLYSPLVLDFISVGLPNSESPAASNARFDLKNDGKITQHGWIRGKQAAFLALDSDGSRMIKDGSQLFGQSTKMPNGKLAENGYLALGQYDDNKDNMIDSKDKIFSKLVVWFDDNGNGISEQGEVKSLAEAGVERLSVNYTQLAGETGFQNGNWFKYKAKFWGPKECPKEGCNSYDVFFGTSVQFVEK